MKKVKFIAFLLVLSVGLMGVGYGAWGETTIIKNTIQIGEKRVEFVQEKTCGNNNQLYNIYPNIDGNDLNNDKSDNFFTTSYQHGPTETSFTMGNLYPGVTIWYEAKIKNLGTLPAVLNDIAVDFSSDSSNILKSNIKVRGQMQHWSKQSDGTDKRIFTYSLPLAGSTQYGRKSDIIKTSGNSNDDGTGSGSGNGNANGNNLVTLGELQEYVNGLIKQNKRTLKPGDYFTFDIDQEYKDALLQEPDLQGLNLASDSPNCLWFTLPKDAGNENQGQSAFFSIKFNFS